MKRAPREDTLLPNAAVARSQRAQTRHFEALAHLRRQLAINNRRMAARPHMHIHAEHAVSLDEEILAACDELSVQSCIHRVRVRRWLINCCHHGSPEMESDILSYAHELSELAAAMGRVGPEYSKESRLLLQQGLVFLEKSEVGAILPEVKLLVSAFMNDIRVALTPTAPGT